jgi:hypothetical protein
MSLLRISRQHAHDLLRAMIRIRRFEEPADGPPPAIAAAAESWNPE